MQIRAFIVLISACFFQLLPATAQKWQKSLDKVDAQFKLGNYAKALKYNEKIKKTTSKKLGKENAYLINYFLNKAKIDIANGDLQLLDNELNTASSLSEKNFGPTSPEHAMNLLRIAEQYSEYGNMVLASSFSGRGVEILQNGNKYSDRYKTYADFVNMKIAGQKGFYYKAIQLSVGIHTEMQKNLGAKGTRFDPISKSETSVNLTKVETDQREADYAFLLSYTGYCLGESGQYHPSDSAFKEAELWIRKNKGKISQEYAQYQIHWATVENLYGNWKESRNIIRDAYTSLKSICKPAHYLIYRSQEKMIDYYAEGDRDSRAVNELNDYYAAILKNFSKTSIYRIRADFMDLNLNNANRVLDGQEKYGMAILNTSFFPLNHPLRTEVLSALGGIAIREQKYKSAGKYFEDMIKTGKEIIGSDAPVYHLYRINAGLFYIRYTNDIVTAREINKESYEEVLSKEISADHPFRSDLLRFSSMVHQESDQYKEAVSELTESLGIIGKKFGTESVKYGIDLNDLADLSIEVSDFKSARGYLNSANNILKSEAEDEDKAYYAASLETEARLLRVEGLYDDAISTIKRSQKLIKKEKIINYNDFKGIETLADVYMNLGKFSGTGELITASIERKQKLFGPDSRFLIDPLLHLTDLLIVTGDYTEAQKNIDRASKIAATVFGEFSTRYAGCLIMQAKLILALGDFEEAEKNAKKAYEIQKSVFNDKNIVVANTLSLLGEITFYKGGNIKDVENYFLEAEAIIVQLLGSDNPLFADNLKNLGTIFLAKEEYQRALGVLQQSKTIWQFKAGKRNNINTADINVLIGDVYYMMKDYDNSRKSYEEAQQLYKKFFSDNHPKFVKTLAKLSKVSYMKGDLKDAKNYIQGALNNYLQFIQEYFPSLSERGKAKFWSSIRPDFEYYNTLALKLNQQYPEMIGALYNNALNTKALLLNSSIKTRERILSSSDTTLHQLFYTWKDKNELLTNALSMSSEELQEEGIDPDKLREEIESIEKQLSARTAGFEGGFNKKKNISWENVKSVLGPNESAIEILRFRLFDHVFTDSIIYMGLYITDKTNAPKYFLFKDGNNLETKYFSMYRNSIRFKIEDEISYEHFWEPIEKALGKASTVYFSADGIFNQINLEAIPTRDGRYVLDNSNIILVKNTKDLYLQKSRLVNSKNEKTATLFGNPKFYASSQPVNNNSKRSSIINDLPGTEREIKQLDKILVLDGWKIKDFLEDSASEVNMKNINNPEVFHIATHGFFTSDKPLKTELEGMSISNYEALENPLLRTGLLLSGAGDLLAATSYNYNLESGILTAYEAMNLSLDNTRLVVLSACETGLGDVEVGEGIYGLQRAFLVAGAETLIMSLFKVSDEATQKLMVKFYDQWLRTGNERQAFIDAKKEIRNEYKYPLYWGAFVMIGLSK